MIKLKGELDYELTRLGLKSGDEIASHTKPGKVNGVVNFDVNFEGWKYACSVWPENYDIINLKNTAL
ncbi:hypothetical protein [Dysgonomonas macrotermitis]|uniref:Uncharacterized protein n=1 Tax=Dysgonomonas macrotermitis TaxID=1346286 RepID=A0A1M4UJX7_9BACT|nr:hypothetical protein [Dysgonomonas macrotermitis]SHE56965.1 hypothetical protein SAMN05444362_101625 [Dysgonomonas macrotermitis]